VDYKFCGQNLFMTDLKLTGEESLKKLIYEAHKSWIMERKYASMQDIYSFGSTNATQ
jgi:hypothetical protein